MVVLRHETWIFADSMRSGVASRKHDDLDAKVSGPGDLSHVYYASSHEEAMQTHYEQQGWGRYKPMPGVTDAAYPAERLEQQLVDYPDDAQLRALNGL